MHRTLVAAFQTRTKMHMIAAASPKKYTNCE